MNLSEWDEAYEYAEEICISLVDKGYNIKPRSYIMCDDSKGIYLQVFDNHRRFFNQYASGIHYSLGEIKKEIDRIATRIVNEYLQTKRMC